MSSRSVQWILSSIIILYSIITSLYFMSANSHFQEVYAGILTALFAYPNLVENASLDKSVLPVIRTLLQEGPWFVNIPFILGALCGFCTSCSVMHLCALLNLLHLVLLCILASYIFWCILIHFIIWCILYFGTSCVLVHFVCSCASFLL